MSMRLPPHPQPLSHVGERGAEGSQCCSSAQERRAAASRHYSSSPAAGRGGWGVRGRLLGAAWIVCLLSVVGCGMNMRDQFRYDPLEQSQFFADGSSAREPVPNTVARGQLRNDDVFYTGKDGDQPVDAMPMETTPELLERGQGRYNVFCAPCHGLAGNGDGTVVQRGFPAPPTFHDDRLRDAPVGYFFDVISNGFGRMYRYDYRIQPADRWAIVAYIRALQLSQNATLDDVPDEQREELEETRP